MAKLVCFVIVALSVLASQTRAISFINNATVSSDILAKIFFDEIQNNSHLYNASVRDTGNYNSMKCVLGLQQIANQLPSLKVLPFLDSWGKFPSGILYGHLRDLGNFDQCMRISTVLNESTGLVKGQYCFAAVPLIQEQVLDVPALSLEQRVGVEISIQDLVRISVAICVPDTCDPKLLTAIFQRATANILNGALSGMYVSRCQTSETPEFEAVNIVGIVIFSIFGGLLALSTIYDVYADYFGKPAVPVLLAFSILTNVKKLFNINTTKNPNNIDCLIGIRVLSMAWVLYGHNYIWSLVLSLMNLIDLIPWFTAASSMHVIMATVSVDSFLFMSGLLVAWIGLRELDKNNGKLNVPLMYLHRYIRLTPPIAAIILFYVSLMKYIGTGPFRKLFNIITTSCDRNWWSTLLYVQNYVHPEDTCIQQSWYLAVDTQLYVLSPLILIPLWKWGRKFIPVMVILSLLSIGCVIATFFTEGWTTFVGTTEPNQMRLTYAPTHTRYTVWLIGVGLGYFMHKNKNKAMRPTTLVQHIGWAVSFLIILAVIYGPYFPMNADRSVTVFEAAMYESLSRPGWVIALSWIVFACHFGFGGVVNTFLSHPYWQPLGRLTYSLYLVHMGVQCINFGTIRTDSYFSDYTQVLLFWSTFGISLMVAIVLTLTFESPVLVIEKALLPGPKKKDIQVIEVNKTEFTESPDKSA